MSVTRRGFFGWLAGLVPTWASVRPSVAPQLGAFMRRYLATRGREDFAHLRAVGQLYGRIRITGPVIAALRHTPPGAFMRAAATEYEDAARHWKAREEAALVRETSDVRPDAIGYAMTGGGLGRPASCALSDEQYARASLGIRDMGILPTPTDPYHGITRSSCRPFVAFEGAPDGPVVHFTVTDSTPVLFRDNDECGCGEDDCATCNPEDDDA